MKSFMIAVSFALVATLFLTTSCGGGTEDNTAALEAARQDSIRVADSLAVVQRTADSLAALPKSIAVTATNTPELSTLVAALTAGELVEVFNGADLFTVFAPANDAFAAAQSTVDMLLKPENKTKLQSVLKYHVVAGALKSTDLTDGQELVTLQGEKLKVVVKDGKVTVGGAEVTAADVPASNGVVHVINKVLVPRKM